MSGFARYRIWIVVVIVVVAVIGGGYYAWRATLPPPTVELELWNGDPGIQAGYLNERIYREFEHKYPNIKIKTTYYPWGTYREKLMALFTVGGEQPDIIGEGINKGWIYQRAGAFKDLSTYIEKWGHKKDIPENAWDAMSYGGVTFGIPYGAHIFVLHYNKELLARAGYTIEPGTQITLDKMLEMASKVYDPEKKIFGFIVRDDWLLAPILGALHYAQGGVLTSTGKYANSPPVDKASEFIINKTAETWLDGIGKAANYVVGGKEALLGASGSTVWTLFAKGTVAFLIDYQTAQADILSINATMSKVMGLAWVPGTVQTTVSSGSYWAIPAKAKHPEEAWKFIEFFLGDAWEYERAKVAMQIPVRMDLAAKPPPEGWSENIKFGMEMWPKAYIDGYFPEYAEIRMKFKTAQEYVWMGTKTPKEAADWIQAETMAIWVKAGHPQ